MWISNYCFSCNFQHNNMKTKAKSVNPNGTLDIFEEMNDIDFLIQSLVDIVKKQFQSRDVEYYITFICCSTNLSNAGRQKYTIPTPGSITTLDFKDPVPLGIPVTLLTGFS
ncbi:hypothetical protein pdam_00006108 [Pocillopora damicornis]|uniref:Uncharacterized protein n=1 Tax=Pocillopora damicornis TaxID=46731 RepID=A0A3M6TDT4_POCDA|nr:hypothetical protein pdam_00006108 [Pocillopora damicornis]